MQKLFAGTREIKKTRKCSSPFSTTTTSWRTILCRSQSVWPDVVIKSSPSVSKSCPKSSLTSLTFLQCFSKLPKKSPNIWVTLVIQFVTKEFQKSPNLVTLNSQYRRKNATRNGRINFHSEPNKCLLFGQADNENNSMNPTTTTTRSTRRRKEQKGQEGKEVKQWRMFCSNKCLNLDEISKGPSPSSSFSATTDIDYHHVCAENCFIVDKSIRNGCIVKSVQPSCPVFYIKSRNQLSFSFLEIDCWRIPTSFHSEYLICCT